MQLNKKRIVLLVLFSLVCGFIAWEWFTLPAVKTVDTFSDSYTIHVGETKQIINYIYPDPSFLRFNIVSKDPDIVETMKNKISIKGIKEGSTIIHCMDKKEIIKEIEITVVPWH